MRDGDDGSNRPSSLFVAESPRAITNFQKRLSEVLLRKNTEGEYVGLYLICLKNVSLAVLMNIHALHDTRHINTIVRQSRPPSSPYYPRPFVHSFILHPLICG